MCLRWNFRFFPFCCLSTKVALRDVFFPSAFQCIPVYLTLNCSSLLFRASISSCWAFSCKMNDTIMKEHCSVSMVDGVKILFVLWSNTFLLFMVLNFTAFIKTFKKPSLSICHKNEFGKYPHTVFHVHPFLSISEEHPLSYWQDEHICIYHLCYSVKYVFKDIMESGGKV